MTLTDDEFLNDRDIPRDCEHGTLARQCELSECKRERDEWKAMHDRECYSLSKAIAEIQSLKIAIEDMRPRMERAERVANAASDYCSCTDLARMFSTAQALSAAVREWDAQK